MTSSPITPAFRAKLDEDRYHHHRLGFWLPKDRKIIVEWVKQLMKRVHAGDPRAQPLDPTLQALQDLVNNDLILKPLSEDMFTEAPDVDPYKQDPEGNKQLRSFDDMLSAFNVLLTSGPQWNDIANKVGLIGCPFNAVLDWPMATASGYMFFLYPQVNDRLKAMLNQWEDYLEKPASVNVLKPDNPNGGWLGKGLQPILAMGNMNGMNIATTYTFPELYQCPNPNDTDTYGFDSWDCFFTRKFQDDKRPIDSPEDDSVTSTHANLPPCNIRCRKFSAATISRAKISAIL